MESYTAYSFVIASSVQQYVCEAHLFSLLYEVKWSEMKVTQSCLTLCDPMDHTVHGILQVRILEWVTFPFSRTSSQPRDRTQVSHVADRFLLNQLSHKESPQCYIAFHFMNRTEFLYPLYYCYWWLVEPSITLLWVIFTPDLHVFLMTMYFRMLIIGCAIIQL